MIIKEQTIRPKDTDAEYEILLGKEIKDFFIDDDGKLKDSIAEYVNCPSCNHDEPQKYLIKNGFTLCICDNCQMQYINPRPSEHIQTDFFSRSKALDLYSEMVEDTKKDRETLIFQPLAKRIFADYGTTPGKLLEVGCRSGLLLDVLKCMNDDWDYYGVEPSNKAVEICRGKGLNVFHGTLESMPSDKKFDLIVYWAVLDHFFDPFQIIKKTFDLLDVGGSVLIGNINIDGFDSVIMDKENTAYTLPERMNFFGVKSIACILERAGFCDIDISTTGRLDVDIVRNYWSEGGENGKCDFLESIVFGPTELAEAFQGFLTENNMSGHMTISAKRK